MSLTLMTISLIIGLVMTAYQGIGSAAGAVQSSEINKLASKVANALNKNAELANKVYQAYQEKDYKLANSLIMSSPVGSAYRELKKEIDENVRTYKSKTKEIEDSNKALREQQDNIPTASYDLIGAIDNRVQLNDRTGKVEEAIRSSDNLVNGGMKNELS